MSNEHIEWNTAAVVLIKMADSGFTSQLSFFKFNFGLYSNLSLQANSAVGCVCVCVCVYIGGGGAMSLVKRW